ncbi:response regulator transcription factor [Ideonella azotifigens]|uniref:Response regulator transcription factor n=1 Tax=Ideonella azotifigens TaxID=513160 RepID=A0ABP3URX1_9BURK|nr:response regulator transcription factor [Ideonella azotifigens]MCD2341910.1 response regulator transcription factor [Ideonella azotifigens]
MRSFLLEDDPEHAAHFKASLAATEFQVRHFWTAGSFFEALAESTPQLIVLDWMLPDLSGYQVLRRVRERFGLAVPIVMLTSVDNEERVVAAFEAGADDFLTKPVARPVLRARLQALARRVNQAPAAFSGSVSFGPYRLDYARQSVRDVDEPDARFALTPREFDLIWLLMNNPDRFIPRAELIAGVWGKSSEVAPHTLAQNVHALRKKLGLARRDIRLAAVYGSGYRLESPGSSR